MKYLENVFIVIVYALKSKIPIDFSSVKEIYKYLINIKEKHIPFIHLRKKTNWERTWNNLEELAKKPQLYNILFQIMRNIYSTNELLNLKGIQNINM